MKLSEKLEEKYSQISLKIFNLTEKIWQSLMVHKRFSLSVAVLTRRNVTNAARRNKYEDAEAPKRHRHRPTELTW